MPAARFAETNVFPSISVALVTIIVLGNSVLLYRKRKVLNFLNCSEAIEPGWKKETNRWSDATRAAFVESCVSS